VQFKLKILTLALAALALLGGAGTPTAQGLPIPSPSRPDLQASHLFVVHFGRNWKARGQIVNNGPGTYSGGRTYKIYENGVLIGAGKVPAPMEQRDVVNLDAPLKKKPKKGTRFTLVISPGDAKPQNDKRTIVYQ
jgi:hypothetical protein